MPSNKDILQQARSFLDRPNYTELETIEMNNEAPKRLFVQLTPNDGTISSLRDPREIHDNGQPVYLYELRGVAVREIPLAKLLISEERAGFLKSLQSAVDDCDAEQLGRWYVALNAFEWPTGCPLAFLDEDPKWAAEKFLEAIERKVEGDYLALHWQAAGHATDRKAALARAALELPSPPKTRIRRDWKPQR